MQKNKLHLFIITLITTLFIVGCENEIDITLPEIHSTPSNGGVLDTITSIAYAQATIDNSPVNITYDWSIKYASGDEVMPIYMSNDTIKWIPNKEGDYVVSVKGVSGNKSVTKNSFLTINNTIKTFQKAMQGEWEGTSEAPFFTTGPRTVHFSIESNGHYSAYMVSHPNTSVLNNGIDIDHPDKKIIVKDLSSNGEALGEITFYHSSDNGILTFLFNKMEFSDDYNKLSFNSGHFSDQYLNIKYTLTKQSANSTPTPSIVDISPNSAEIGKSTSLITITGNNTSWNTGAEIDYVSLTKNNDIIPNSSLNVLTDELITTTFNIPVSASTGCYDVTVHYLTSDFIRLNCIFTVTDIPDDSFNGSIESISPNSAVVGEVTPTLTVTGNNTSWNSGAGIYYVALANSNDTIRGSNLNIINNRQITATFNIPSSAETGCYDVITYDLKDDILSLNCEFTISD